MPPEVRAYFWRSTIFSSIRHCSAPLPKPGGATVRIASREEVGRLPRWSSRSRAGAEVDHRFYELVEDTLTDGFMLRLSGDREWRRGRRDLSPASSSIRTCSAASAALPMLLFRYGPPHLAALSMRAAYPDGRMQRRRRAPRCRRHVGYGADRCAGRRAAAARARAFLRDGSAQGISRPQPHSIGMPGAALGCPRASPACR